MIAASSFQQKNITEHRKETATYRHSCNSEDSRRHRRWQSNRNCEFLSSSQTISGKMTGEIHKTVEKKLVCITYQLVVKIYINLLVLLGLCCAANILEFDQLKSMAIWCSISWASTSTNYTSIPTDDQHIGSWFRQRVWRQYPWNECRREPGGGRYQNLHVFPG